MVARVFAPQVRQLLLPFIAAYWLEAQAMHEEEEEEPTSALAVPMGHAMQAAWPIKLAYLPAEQLVHEDDPAFEALPTKQDAQEVYCKFPV